MAGRVLRTYGRWGGGSNRTSDDLWLKAVQPDRRSPLFSTSSDNSSQQSSLSSSSADESSHISELRNKIAKAPRVVLEDCMKENKPPPGKRSNKKAERQAKRPSRQTTSRRKQHQDSVCDEQQYDFSDIEKHSLIISDSPGTRNASHSAESEHRKSSRRRRSVARRVVTVSTSTPTRLCASLASLQLSQDAASQPLHRRPGLRSSDSSQSSDGHCCSLEPNNIFHEKHEVAPCVRSGTLCTADSKNGTFDTSGDLFADSIHNSLYVSSRRSKRHRNVNCEDASEIFSISDDLFESANNSLGDNVTPARDIEELELSAIEEDDEVCDTLDTSYSQPEKKLRSSGSDISDLVDSKESGDSGGDDEHSSVKVSDNPNISRYILIKDSEEVGSASSSKYVTPCGGSTHHSRSVVEELRSELDLRCHSFKDMLTPVRTRTMKLTIPPKAKLLKQCDQTDYISFSRAITPRTMKSVKKIGEGVYGEVFRGQTTDKQSVALKVMPIEGDFDVNDEPQKTFEEMLPEILISKELSALKEPGRNQTSNFVQVNRVSCVQGSYPSKLLDEWDAYSHSKHTENDRPNVFNRSQLFIVFEFADAGSDLEHYKFTSAVQSLAVFKQVAWALAVAESAIQFEHRDLHWGNILVKTTDERVVEYSLNGNTYALDSHGLHVTIIDFTLSRLTQEGTTVFSDLSKDESLFQGDAEYDYQFEIYRKMREVNLDDWERFHPRTNILWLHYLADKLLTKKRYKSSAKSHQEGYAVLKALESDLLNYDSAFDLVMNFSSMVP